MDDASSFICEHTAEYVLVPKLKQILSQCFKKVIPIFPWATREGSNISRKIHKYDEFKVVGLYPRRPKFFSTDNPKIIVKINDRILHGADIGMQSGIPIIAGCPLINNFWEMDDNTNCAWIKLNGRFNETFEIDFNRKESFLNNKLKTEFIFENEADLLIFLNDNLRLMDLNSALVIFKQIRMLNNDEGYFSFSRYGDNYKPLYFLLK